MRTLKTLAGFTTITLLAIWGPSPALANNPPAGAYAFVTTAATGSVVEFVAGAGQANNLIVTANAWTVTFDDIVPITPGTGCVTPSSGGLGRPDNTKVTCTVSTPWPFTKVYASDGADTVTLTAPAGSASEIGTVYIYGGTGDDSISLVDADDPVGYLYFYGEAGNDHLTDANINGGEILALYGGDGDDTLDCGAPQVWFWVAMNGGNGADTMSGKCAADYSDRSTPVNVTLDNTANDGGPGEGDNVWTSVYSVTGGSGNDVLSSPYGAADLVGNAGNDMLFGSAYDDVLTGGAGADFVDGFGGYDDCRGGNDALDTVIYCELIN